MAKIKLKTGSAAKQSATKSTRKSSTTKGTQAKRGPGRPKGSTNKQKTTKAASTPKRTNGRVRADQATIKRHVKALERVGAKREKLRREYEAAVEEVVAAANEALEDEVGMSLVADTLKLSRQYLYKAIETHANGKKKPGRPPSKKTKASSNGRKTTSKKSTSKRGPGRPKGSKNKPKVKTRK